MLHIDDKSVLLVDKKYFVRAFQLYIIDER